MCRIKAANTAVVYVNGRRIGLVPYGSEKALQEYARFLAEWTNAEIKETVRTEKKTPATAIPAPPVANNADVIGRRLGVRYIIDYDGDICYLGLHDQSSSGTIKIGTTVYAYWH